MEFVCIALCLILLGLIAYKNYKVRMSTNKFNNEALIQNQPKLDKNLNLLLTLLCIGFIACYFLRLFTIDVFFEVSAVDGSGIFTNFQIWFLTILRFFTQGMVIIVMIGPLFKLKFLNDIMSFFCFPVAVLNLIFLRLNLIAFEGTSWSFFSYRGIEFMIETVLAVLICGIYLYNKIKSKDFDKKTIFKTLCLGFLVFFGFSISMMYPCTFENVIGAVAPAAEDFSLTHRVCLYFVLIVGLVLYFTLKNKSNTAKYVTCLMLSITGFCSFFVTYTWNIPLTALPLHLCNAALIISMLSFIFKSKKLFYFTYFVNVLGALCALFMPDTEGSFMTAGNVRFWLNHIVVIIVPIVAVAWRVFPRPNLKMMKNSIIVFTIYFIIACASNMIICGMGYEVNYFFIENNFFIDKFPWAYPLRADFVYEVSMFGLTMYVWPVYWACIFVVYIALMFGIWLVYAYFYKVGDAITKTYRLEHLDKIDMLNFKQEVLKGRNIKMPINDNNVNQIIIKDFTKVYGNSKEAAVKEFSLTVNQGEVFGFLGHNGAGKSTLIKSMVGIQSITSGSISIAGYDITHQPLQAKISLGYVSDNHAVYEKLTGREYINFVADLYLVSKEDREKRLKKYAKLFNLTNDLDREIKGYSHGMKQKLVVIASIIHAPKVWILDEPLTGLDPMSSHQIKTLMRDMANEGHIVFFSSHVIEVVEKICDKIAIITKGKLKGVFTIEQLKDKKLSLEDLYVDMADEMAETYKEGLVNERESSKKDKVNDKNADDKINTDDKINADDKKNHGNEDSDKNNK